MHVYSAVAVECCYQNTGIATSVAITMFSGQDLATAVGVPLFYGICEATFLGCYCLICWKLGWTKAPADENICKVITTSYEVKELSDAEPEAIEVVLGSPEKVEAGTPSDMIFASSQTGYQIDEVSLDSLTKTDESTPERKGSEDFPIEDPEELSGGKKYAAVEMSATPKSSDLESKRAGVTSHFKGSPIEEPPIPADGKQID